MMSNCHNYDPCRYRPRAIASIVAFVGAVCCCLSGARSDEVLRAGIVGCDTSHAIHFTQLLNDPAADGPLARVAVVAAFPGGSPDIASSRDRLEAFTSQLRESGVEIVDSIDKLLPRVDVVLLESVDGRVHLEQVRPILASGKRVFVDKPAAASLADVMAIFKLSEETGTPCFSSSALRYCDEVANLVGRKDVGDVLGASASSPCAIEPHHPDLMWYGIHGVEALYAMMGPGCEQVTRVHTDGADVAVGVWPDSRIGVFRGIRDGHRAFAMQLFGTRGIAQSEGFSGYEPLVERICQFFIDGVPPVGASETIEMFAFMEAADESKRRGGVPVKLQEVIQRAKTGE